MKVDVVPKPGKLVDADVVARLRDYLNAKMEEQLERDRRRADRFRDYCERRQRTSPWGVPFLNRAP